MIEKTADTGNLPNEDGKSYEDVLPQVNIAFLMENDQAVRIGVAREMARPRMDELKATEESGYDFNTGLPDGSGGNAQLDPWRANAFDISYEKYFGQRSGYVSVAGFYKDLESYIFRQTDPNHDSRKFARRDPRCFVQRSPRSGADDRRLHPPGERQWRLPLGPRAHGLNAFRHVVGCT